MVRHILCPTVSVMRPEVEKVRRRFATFSACCVSDASRRVDRRSVIPRVQSFM